MVLRHLERLAGEQYRAVGMPHIADHEPLSVAILRGYALAGRAWVALDDEDDPIGYVIVDVVDGNSHVEQVSVAPEHQGEGVGRALLDEVATWSRRAGHPAITLTTFRDVPWNGPLYRHLGFRVLAEHELGDELRARRDAETAHGLDPALRVCMLLDLAG